MVARINTVAFNGVEVQAVDVQVQISNGLPAFTIVGPNYPDTRKFLWAVMFLSIFFWLFPAEASDEKLSIGQIAPSYCLSKTEKQKELDYHYSQDFSEPAYAVDRSGWTWVNKPDYDGDYDFLQSPKKDKATQFPKLYAKPCNAKKQLLGSCQRAGSVFSKSVGVAFIGGYQANPVGFSMAASYAIFGETIIPIPSSGSRAARYRGDIPSKKLAAVRGSKDELMIFDGKEFQTFKLEKAIPRKDDLPSWAIQNDPVTNRDYVSSNGLLGTSPFLYEIKDGMQFDEIYLDKNLVDGVFKIFTIVGDRQSWIIERDGIYVETEKAYRRVAHRGPTAFITAPADIGIAEDGNIYFQLEAEGNEKVQPYILHRSGQICDIPLNLNDDIELYFAD